MTFKQSIFYVKVGIEIKVELNGIKLSISSKNRTCHKVFPDFKMEFCNSNSGDKSTNNQKNLKVVADYDKDEILIIGNQ